MSVHGCMSRSLDTPSVRQMCLADVPLAVKVHLESFSGFFLTFLGPAFLCELYTATLADPSGIGFVAENGEGICGFVTGTAQPSGFYRRLLRKRWWRFAVASIVPGMRNPSIIPRLLRAFSMPEGTSNKEGHATLMSVAVLPSIQGKGVGQSLVRAFLLEATRRGLKFVDLTTDRDHNDGTNHFYQKMGFICERTSITPEGRAMNAYLIEL